MGAICSNLPGVPKVPELSFDKSKLTGPISAATGGLAAKRAPIEAELKKKPENKDKSADEIKKMAAEKLVNDNCKDAIKEVAEQCWEIVEPLLDEQIDGNESLADLPDMIKDKAKDAVKKNTVDKMVRSAFIKAAMGGKIDADGDGVVDEDGAEDADGDGVEDGFQEGGDEGGDDE